jgi:hypothetical protein
MVALALTTSVLVQGPGRTALVTTDVLVVGSNGDPIIDLSREDFEVLSDGAPVALGAFGSAPAELAVVLLLDVSTSQALKRHEAHTAVAEHWLPSLRAGDRARIGVIDNRRSSADGCRPTAPPAWLPRASSIALNRAVADLGHDGRGDSA